MADDDGPTSARPDPAGPSGAFVARIWHDGQDLRARVRHTADLADADQVATIRGARDHVLPDLVDRFRRWAEAFADGDGSTEPPADGALTPR
jgi:hypothetical protein